MSRAPLRDLFGKRTHRPPGRLDFLFDRHPVPAPGAVPVPVPEAASGRQRIVPQPVREYTHSPRGFKSSQPRPFGVPEPIATLLEVAVIVVLGVLAATVGAPPSTPGQP